MSDANSELSLTGWKRFLPDLGLACFDTLLEQETAESWTVRRDLDDMEKAFGFPAGGWLDHPYDSANIPRDPDERDVWISRWQEWQRYAAQRGRPMSSCRHVIELMTELGIFERREGNGVVRWVIASPLPLVEDVLDLTAEQLAVENEHRWRDQVSDAHKAIIYWLYHQRTNDPLLRVEVTIASLASELDLDAENVCNALRVISEGANDILLSNHRGHAGLDDTFTITVDWRRFDEERPIHELDLAIPCR